ncbi:hypothetical protein ACJ73_03664 [Blastomyces percursus]|uniref:Uncharacterized protein n=1 Tax=Blastomyces percursus TaxID=1658174 RepID=A0A1J9Q864_9EURO|nr:hypothetical protein ACJ73_03664 [Blastomyces percursus]
MAHSAYVENRLKSAEPRVSGLEESQFPILKVSETGSSVLASGIYFSTTPRQIGLIQQLSALQCHIVQLLNSAYRHATVIADKNIEVPT